MWEHHPRIRLCADWVLQGGVIAYPTEAVWGLGCDPFNAHAVKQILTLKHRPADKGLILVASDIAQFNFLLHDLDSTLYNTLQQAWPGHVTWLVPHLQRVPAIVSGRFDTIALRVSQHPVVRAICAKVGGAIVSTSANPAGKPPATTLLAARRYFGRTETNPVLFSPGQVGRAGKPSEIRDLMSGRVIRAGS